MACPSGVTRYDSLQYLKNEDGESRKEESRSSRVGKAMTRKAGENIISGNCYNIKGYVELPIQRNAVSH